MKKIAICLGVLFVAASLGGGLLIYRGSKEREALAKTLDEVRESLAAVQAANMKAEAEIASGKTREDELAKRLEESVQQKAKSDQAQLRLEADLSAAKSQIDKTASELREATQAGEAKQKAKDALEAFQRKYVEAASAWSDTVSTAVASVSAAERKLFSEPSAQSFDRHGRALSSLQDTIKNAEGLIQGVREFATASRDPLRESGSAVTAALRECDSAKTSMDRLSAEVQRCIAARNKQSFPVNANEGGWQASDLTVREGDSVAVSASGKWTWGPRLGTPGGIGPEGEDGGESYRLSPDFGNGALLMRVRGADELLSGWESFETEVAGRVEFRINDNQVSDNSGRITVDMWVFQALKSR